MIETVPRRLKPSTVETIRGQLEFQRSDRPVAFAFHFSQLEDRGMPVDYADVENLTEREADSVRHLLASSIAYGRGRIRRAQALAISLNGGKPEQQNDEWQIRVKQLEEALADLCAAFGLTPPL